MSAVEEYQTVAKQVVQKPGFYTIVSVADAAIAELRGDVATMRGILAAAKADEGSTAGWDAARQAARQSDEYLERAERVEAELATEREHPTSVLQCAACQRLAVVQNVQLAARAELAEGDLAAVRARRCEGCGHADKNGDPWGCRANMLLFPMPTECCNHWLEARV